MENHEDKFYALKSLLRFNCFPKQLQITFYKITDLLNAFYGCWTWFL